VVKKRGGRHSSDASLQHNQLLSSGGAHVEILRKKNGRKKMTPANEIPEETGSNLSKY
jgi:hypothetical protein